MLFQTSESRHRRSPASSRTTAISAAQWTCWIPNGSLLISDDWNRGRLSAQLLEFARPLTLIVPARRPTPGPFSFLISVASTSSQRIFDSSGRPDLAAGFPLSLPEIKSERIDGANLRGADWPRCGQRPEQHATLVHPCSAIGAYERHCNIFGKIEAGGEGAARRTPRHDQGSPVVSSRSASLHIRSAMAIVVRWADPGCPSHEDAG